MRDARCRRSMRILGATTASRPDGRPRPDVSVGTLARTLTLSSSSSSGKDVSGAVLVVRGQVCGARSAKLSRKTPTKRMRTQPDPPCGR